MSDTGICPTCGLPKDICVCGEIAKEAQRVKITTERRRYRKTYTIVEGFDSSVDMRALAKELKKKLACGGTYKDNRIELQGEHRRKVKELLVKMNYNEDQIDIY